MEKWKELFARLKGELVTQLNLLATAVLLYISQQPNAPIEDILGFLPEGFHAVAKVALPVVWGILVQVAIELLKKRTAEKVTTEIGG